MAPSPEVSPHPSPPAAQAGRPSALSIWAALITVYIVWGSTYLAIRFVVAGLPPWLTAGIRFVVAGGLLYAFRRLRGDPAPTVRQWRSAAIVGGLLLLGGNGAVVWAEQQVPSGVTALLVATVPLWMVLADLVLPGRKPSAWTLLGILIGFGGIAVLIGPQQLLDTGGQLDLLGVGAILLGSFLWAIGSIYSRRADLPASPLLGTGMEMLAGGIGLLALGTAAGEWGRLDIVAAPASSWAGLVYLIIVGSWIGFSAYTWLLRAAPTALVSTYAYVNPLVAVGLGYLLGGEELTPRVLVATAVIVGAVALITRLRKD